MHAAPPYKKESLSVATGSEEADHHYYNHCIKTLLSVQHNHVNSHRFEFRKFFIHSPVVQSVLRTILLLLYVSIANLFIYLLSTIPHSVTRPRDLFFIYINIFVKMYILYQGWQISGTGEMFDCTQKTFMCLYIFIIYIDLARNCSIFSRVLDIKIFQVI